MQVRSTASGHSVPPTWPSMPRHFIILLLLGALAQLAALNPASAQEGQGPGPSLVAAREPAPEIDGRVDFTPAAPWQPLLAVDWSRRRAQADAWFRSDWSPRGLHLSVMLPYPSDTSRRAGAPSPPPFVAHMGFEGGTGPYELQCFPLLEPVSRMTTRSQPYLFNHRLGANARVGERGHLLCHELTLRGILADSLETRWDTASDGRVQFEALVPWTTLRLPVPAGGTELPFRLLVARPGREPLRWGDSTTMGRIHLLTGPSSVAERAAPTTVPLVAATLVRQPEEVNAAFALAGRADSPVPVEFNLVDRVGRVRSRASGVTAGDAAMVRLPTAGLPDGRYTLRVLQGGVVRGERSIRLAGHAVTAEIEQPRTALVRRIARLRGRPVPAWMTGHLARAEAVLDLAVLPARPAPADLDATKKTIADVEAIVRALEERRRPEAAREGYAHRAGFAVDGQRGMVTFVPTNAAGARVTIHAGRQAASSITPRLYGTFSEAVHYDRPLYSDLDAQELRNPSFEWGHPSPEQTVESFVRSRELDSAAATAALGGRWLARIPATLDEVAAPWFAVGRGSARFTLDCEAYNDRSCARITASEGAHDVGVAQVISLPAWRTTRYHLRGFVRSNGTVRSARVLLYHDGQPVATSPVPAIGTEWRAFEADLETPHLPGPQNTFLLALVFDGPGRLDVDYVTLYPADAVDGFDPQAVAQLRELTTGWVRWPGGNYASAYRWRDGVGPRDTRPSTANPSWPGLNANSIGTDEYLRLCQLIGAEPMITVNAGNGTPEEAARWVEYVNGDTTTAMGRLRAANGHPAPYRVRYWNVGNELWGHWQIGYTDGEGYARRYMAFARAMSAVDPSIQLIANGHGGHSESPPDPWNRPLLAQHGRALEVIDVHTYVQVPAEKGVAPSEQVFLLSAIPLSYERWLMEFRDDLLRRGLPRLRVIVGEYNGWVRTGSPPTDRLGDLLVYAAYLHAFIRQSEYVVGANATEYSPFDPRALPFARMHPRFDLFRIYARHAGTRPVAATLETPVRQQPRHVGRDVVPIFNLPIVDAVALTDSVDGSLGISLINRNMERAMPVEVRLDDFEPQADGRWFLFGASSAAGVQEQSVAVANTFTVMLPPHSVSLIKLRPKTATGG